MTYAQYIKAMFANPKTQKRYINLGNTIRSKRTDEELDQWFKNLPPSSQRVYGTAMKHVSQWKAIFQQRPHKQRVSNPLYELLEEDTLSVLEDNRPVSWDMEDKTHLIPNFRVFVINEVMIAIPKDVADKIQKSDSKYLYQ